MHVVSSSPSGFVELLHLLPKMTKSCRCWPRHSALRLHWHSAWVNPSSHLLHLLHHERIHHGQWIQAPHSGKHHGLISHVGALRPCTLSAGLSHGDHKSANKDKIKILNKFDAGQGKQQAINQLESMQTRSDGRTLSHSKQLSFNHLHHTFQP